MVRAKSSARKNTGSLQRGLTSSQAGLQSPGAEESPFLPMPPARSPEARLLHRPQPQTAVAPQKAQAEPGIAGPSRVTAPRSAAQPAVAKDKTRVRGTTAGASPAPAAPATIPGAPGSSGRKGQPSSIAPAAAGPSGGKGQAAGPAPGAAGPSGTRTHATQGEEDPFGAAGQGWSGGQGSGDEPPPDNTNNQRDRRGSHAPAAGGGGGGDDGSSSSSGDDDDDKNKNNNHDSDASDSEDEAESNNNETTENSTEQSQQQGPAAPAAAAARPQQAAPVLVRTLPSGRVPTGRVRQRPQARDAAFRGQHRPRLPGPSPQSHKIHKRRHKPGKVALREIRKYQASTDLLLPKAPFARVVREIVHDVDRTAGQITCITRDAMLVLQEAGEAYIVERMEYANLCAIHAGRVTVKPQDMQLAARLQNGSKQ